MDKRNKTNHRKTPAALIIPLRVPADMNTRITRISDESGLSRADIMRQSIARGIDELEELLTKPSKVAA